MTAARLPKHFKDFLMILFNIIRDGLVHFKVQIYKNFTGFCVNKDGSGSDLA